MRSNFLFILFTGVFTLVTSSGYAQPQTNIGTSTLTSVGHALPTTHTYSTYLGSYAGGSNANGGTKNTNIGYAAGDSNTGDYTTIIGYYAGNKNTGNLNTYIGSQSGQYNTSGEYNTFLGSSSGYKNTTGHRNTYLGANAGAENTTGHRNVYLGGWAGYSNETGNYNTFVGRSAGYNNTGSSNVFIGNEAGIDEIDSEKLYIDNSGTSTPLLYGDFAKDSLVVNGAFTIKNNTVSEGRFLICGPNGEAIWSPITLSEDTSLVGIDYRSNTYIGENTGQSITTGVGENNTFLGYDAGKNTNAGNNNTFLGAKTGLNAFGSQGNGSDNILIGYDCTLDSGSRNILIGNRGSIVQGERNDRLEITGKGQNRPLIEGDFAKDSLVINGKMKVDNKLAIGTETTFPTTLDSGAVDISAYTLFAKGGILTEEVRIQTGWADYVFEEDYELKSLEEVESYIAINGHLPNVPSATQVAAQGVELGDISRIQQEKIEELFLFTIEQEKKIKRQEKDIEELKTLVNALLEKNK